MVVPLILAAVCVALILTGGHLPGDERFPPLALAAFGLLTIFLTLVCFVEAGWRLRLDEEGIAVRTFRRFDLWPWSDFENGNVVGPEGSATRFGHRQRGFPSRVLELSLLSEYDRAEVLRAIGSHWPEVARDPLPETLELHFRTPFDRRRIRLDGRGVTVRHGKKSWCFDWDDVERIAVTRAWPSHAGFRRLTIEFPGQQLRFEARAASNKRYARTFDGASPAVLAGFVCKHAPGDRLREGLVCVGLTDRRQALLQRDALLRGLHKNRWLFLRLHLIAGIGFAAAFVSIRFYVPDDGQLALFGGVMLALFALGPAHGVYWQMRLRVKQLNRILSQSERKQED